MRVLILILAATVYGCTDNPTKPVRSFSEYLESLGYSFYNPPRSDRGPGSVFRLARAQSGKIVISPVCGQLFESIEPVRANISLPKDKSTEERGIEFWISFLADLLNNPGDVSGKFSSKATFAVQFDGTQSHYLNEEQMVNDKGVARRITPACYARLKQLSKSGELRDNIFIIQDAVRISTGTYTFSKEALANGQGKIEVDKIIDVKTGVRWSKKTERSFSIDEPRYVAFVAFLLKDYVETGLTTAGTAIVKAERMDPSVFKE